jgi:hypothetical protein
LLKNLLEARNRTKPAERNGTDTKGNIPKQNKTQQPHFKQLGEEKQNMGTTTATRENAEQGNKNTETKNQTAATSRKQSQTTTENII